PQRTLARPAEVSGVGFLTGANVRLRFLPAPPDTGVVFVRTDLRTTPRIPATVRNVTGTQRRTTLGRAPAYVTPVEHVLAALGWQSHTQNVIPERFITDVAGCRTFLLEDEANEFRRQGFGARLSPADLLVFGPRGPICNCLRYANEPARHKVLDIIGDLALF